MILRGLLLAAVALSYELAQDVIGEGTCSLDKQEVTHPGMCECNKECCNGDESERMAGGCPVDVVVAIDMCLCTNMTMTAYKRFGMELINSLNTEFGISDDVNSARLHIFQFMEDTHDVTNFNTFTKGELISDVLRMDYHQYHGKATNVRKAVQYGAKILQSSERVNAEPRQIFVMVTNGYSDEDLVSQRDVEAELQGLQGVPNLKTVFVAREDSSIAGDQNTHTNEDVAKYFDQRESLGSFLAPQQIVNDINCPAPPAPQMERECMCTCDVPMGCHGPEGPAGNDGRVGASGQDGEPGRPGNDGPEGPMGDVGEVGQPGPCGMPGHAGEKGFPGEDGVPGLSGNSGPQGAQGPPGKPGSAGQKGEKGDAGFTGEPGLNGVIGEPGDSGQPGEQGPQGGLDQETLKWLVNKIFMEELGAMGITTPQT